MAATVTILNPQSYERSPWKNGRGTLVNIADAFDETAASRDWDSLIWRFGRTAIVEDGPFSHLPGIDRMQMVIKGRGLVLKSPTEEFDERMPFTPVRFRGETEIMSLLEAGEVEVVNLMGARGKVAIDLRAFTGRGDAVLRPGVHLVYAPVAGCKVRLGDADHELAADASLKCVARKPLAFGLAAGTAIVGSIYPA